MGPRSLSHSRHPPPPVLGTDPLPSRSSPLLPPLPQPRMPSPLLSTHLKWPQPHNLAQNRCLTPKEM